MFLSCVPSHASTQLLDRELDDTSALSRTFAVGKFRGKRLASRVDDLLDMCLRHLLSFVAHIAPDHEQPKLWLTDRATM